MFSDYYPQTPLHSPLSAFLPVQPRPRPPVLSMQAPSCTGTKAGGCGVAVDRGERWPERHPHARGQGPGRGKLGACPEAKADRGRGGGGGFVKEGNQSTYRGLRPKAGVYSLGILSYSLLRVSLYTLC